jgi:hypothetical protein
VKYSKYINFFREDSVKTLQPRLFPSLSAAAPKTFHPTYFHPASLPLQLWDGIFKIPEVLRKIFEPPAPFKPEKRHRRQAGEKRNDRRIKFKVEVLAYPLRPQASHIPLRGELKNLGKEGVCVEFLKTVKENHLFLLDFQLPEEKNVRLPARVIWSRDRLSGFELISAHHARKILKESRSA